MTGDLGGELGDLGRQSVQFHGEGLYLGLGPSEQLENLSSRDGGLRHVDVDVRDERRLGDCDVCLVLLSAVVSDSSGFSAPRRVTAQVTLSAGDWVNVR